MTSPVDPNERLAEAEKQVRITLEQVEDDHAVVADLSFIREEIERIRETIDANT